MYETFTRKHLTYFGIFTAILIATAFSLLFVSLYQDAVYDDDKSLYDTNKAMFTKAQDSIASRLHAFAYANWVASNDTTVRKIKHIRQIRQHITIENYQDSLDNCRLDFIRGKSDCTASYEEYKNARILLTQTLEHRASKEVKTGRLLCQHDKYDDHLVCKPETRKIYIPNTVTITTYDTIWTTGYGSREQWIHLASKYADSVVTSAKIEYQSYTGHQYHFLLKSESLLWYIYISSWCIVPIIGLIWIFIAYIQISSYLKSRFH